MPELKPSVRTSLEVGFPDGEPPEKFLKYRGRAMRSIGCEAAFPFEDAQFEVVLMDGSFVTRASVKEAHRVLRPEGRLYFIVPERVSGGGPGLTLPEIYSIVRDGFNIVEVERPAWWYFGCRGRTLTICAQKKNWRSLVNTYRPYVV